MRGKKIQPEAECEWCNKPLPTLRHPNARFCDPTCRRRNHLDKTRGSKGVKCLICGKLFTRVGSHVTQVHGYSSALEYRSEFGLMQKETRTEEHAEEMRNKVTEESIKNLKSGADTRFVKGEINDGVRMFWAQRRRTEAYKELGGTLRG